MPRKDIVVKLKKVAWALLTILLLTSTSSSIVFKMIAKANPQTTWIVDYFGSGNFTKIQDAITNASVKSGDTIFVRNGIYRENLNINKSLSFVAESVDSTIIHGDGIGNVVTIVNVDNVNLTGFTVENGGLQINDNVISVAYSDGTVISHNKITASNNGIGLYYSSRTIVLGNIIFSNANAEILVASSGGTIIADNTISGGLRGILVQGSSANTILGNTLFANDYEGIALSLSVNNTIYHNNFGNNTNQASSDARNFWDNDGEGNYWGNNYKGQDTNEDGIGDTPYTIELEHNNQDNYPLMGPFVIFNLVYKGETYPVTIVSNSSVSEPIFEIEPETGNRIMRFNADDLKDTIGFCRIAIPTDLMKLPFILVINNEEITPTVLGASNETYVYLYFTYSHENNTITIVSSEALRLYAELLGNYSRLQMDFNALSSNYSALLSIYGVLLENYTELWANFNALNESYRQISGLNASYYELHNNYLDLQTDFAGLTANYSQLQENYTTLWTGLNSLSLSYSALSNSYLALRVDFLDLNMSYDALLNFRNILEENYTQLQESYDDLNRSYQEHLLNYSQQMQNLQSLMYILIAIITVFLITTIYLSRQAHRATKPKTEVFQEEKHS